MAKTLIGLCIGLLLASMAQAAIEVFPFADDQQRDRFQHLTELLRCPKCQNQTIGGSNSPIAQDMREQLFTLLQQGHSDQEVIDYMKARFGDYVVYQPPMRQDTWVLWWLPPLSLLAGVIIILGLVWHKRRQSKGAVEADSSSHEAQRAARLQQVLDRYADDKDIPS